jgi:hypothetical protein
MSIWQNEQFYKIGSAANGGQENYRVVDDHMGITTFFLSFFI